MDYELKTEWLDEGFCFICKKEHSSFNKARQVYGENIPRDVVFSFDEFYITINDEASFCRDCIKEVLLSSYDSYELRGLTMEIDGLITQLDPPRPPTELEIKRKEFSYRLRKQVLERDGYRCKLCDSWKNLHVDHIKPLSKGGDNTIENLQVLCQKCNCKKGSKYDATI